MQLNQKRLGQTLLFTVIAVQSATTLWAQPIPENAPPVAAADVVIPISEEEVTDRTVVVTATLDPTSMEATATSTTVVTRQDLEARQVRSVAEAIRLSPGVVIAANGSPGQTSGLFIRGAKTQNNLVRLNGRRLPFNLAGAFNLEDLSTSNVERIEVSRGPLSAVHGGPAIGGVINIITRDGRDELDSFSGSISAEGGSYQTFAAAVEARAAYGPWDFSAGYDRFDSDFQRDNNQYRRNNLLGSTGVQITEAVYADLMVYYNTTDAGSPNAVNSPSLNANLERETWLISPAVTVEMTEWWTQTTYYSHAQSRQVATGFNPSFGTNFGQDNRIQVDTDEVETKGTFQVAENWNITAGSSVSSERYYRVINLPNQFNTPTTPAGTRDINDTRTNVGLFLETQWQPLEGWNLIGNVRWDHYSDFDEPLTWRIGTSYEVPTVGTIVHANYATAYAPPTPQDVATVFGGVANLSAETSAGWEAGITQPLWDGKIEIFGTYFHNDVQDLIEFRTGPGGGFIPFNIGKATLEGVETGIKVAWIPEVELQLNYTYLTAEDEDAATRLIRRPRHLFNGQLTVFPVEQVTISLDWTWAVGREDNNPATFTRQDNEDYLLMRVAAAWQICDNVKVFGRIENLTNDQYQEVLGFPALDQAAYGGVEVMF
jgi:vitamin B12 transporter